jgi:hypothetical protein
MGTGLIINSSTARLDSFQNLGFHQNLVNLAKAELCTNQQNPLPMMKG